LSTKARRKQRAFGGSVCSQTKPDLVLSQRKRTVEDTCQKGRIEKSSRKLSSAGGQANEQGTEIISKLRKKRSVKKHHPAELSSMAKLLSGNKVIQEKGGRPA